MMKLCANIDYFEKNIGMVQASNVLRKAGFEYVDYTPKLVDFQWRVFDKEFTTLCDHGLKVYQSHAPFNRYGKYESIEEHMRLVELSLEAAARSGAKYLVVHGDEFEATRCYNPEATKLYNYELFAPIVEQAVKKGVNIAFENVFQDDLSIPRYGSIAEELAALIDMFSCPQVCCCWDFGHGAVAYPQGQQDAIEILGNRIQCTHVHDNYLESDMHLIPMLGKINWTECMKVFNAVSKTEVFSFELVYGNVTDETAYPLAQLLYAIGCKLVAD